MGFRGEGPPRRFGREDPDAPDPAESSHASERRRRPRAPLLLALVVVLLVVALVLGVIFLLRTFGDSVSGTSVATETLKSGPEPHVRLVNGPGQVSIEGVENLDTVEYEAVRYARGPDPAAAKQNASEVPVDISREDSTLVLQTDGGRETGADYALRVPVGSIIEVESEAGDVQVRGISGNVKVKADAGDVEINDVGGSVTVDAPQGDVDLAGMNTETGQAELTVGSGDVGLRDVVLGTLEAAVEAGDVTLSGRFSGSGRVTVETGSIVARIPFEDAKNLVLDARVGEVVRESTLEEAPEGSSGKDSS